jgi:hypothetical protein
VLISLLFEENQQQEQQVMYELKHYHCQQTHEVYHKMFSIVNPHVLPKKKKKLKIKKRKLLFKSLTSLFINPLSRF